MSMQRILTGEEIDDRQQLEAVIKKSFTSFLLVGKALVEIRDRKLWRDGFTSFNAYCAEKWGFKKANANFLIQSAEVAGALSEKSANRLANSKQARTLGKVPAPDRERVLEAASQQAATEGRPMTSQDITNAATEQEPPVDIESTVIESQPVTPTDTAPAPESAPAEPRVWPEAEFKKTVTIILTEYQHEGGAVELTRSAQFLRDWAKSIEKHAKWLTAQGVKI